MGGTRPNPISGQGDQKVTKTKVSKPIFHNEQKDQAELQR